ncbi:hypothetical protein [Kribbella caucasensis]|uniref:hypothetical protein n=1 Tax=Kribbella caucasensis TaxID=2512215 RepID=UPI00105C8FD8|nr:hypothetical protein [Kribbella sp. VKM Ac-2527]
MTSKDDPGESKGNLGLAPDRGDTLFGLALLVALLVVIAFAVDVQVAVIVLGLLIGAYGLLSLVLSFLYRSLSRGFGNAIRWTVGFLGRWFSFW